MATIINTPGSTEGDSGAGWAVAVIILIAVIGVGAYFWSQRQAPAQNPGMNINVTLPTGSNDTPKSPATN